MAEHFSEVKILQNQGRVAGLREGRVPFYEPGLEELIARSAGRLHFDGSQKLAEVVREADVLFVDVSTPQGGDGSADLSNVADAARAIGRALGGSTPRARPLVVVNKSTVPVGSAYYVSTLVSDGIDDAGGEGAAFRVASNPEFLREGSAVHDSLLPDRVVVGTDSREALDALRTLYTPMLPHGMGSAPQGSSTVRHNGPCERRDDQVRLKRLPCHQGELH